MAEVNPHCPVRQCRTKKPHTDDVIVQMLLSFTSHPQVYLHWVKKTIEELRNSMLDDFNRGREIAWMSRIRLVEELYYRSVYLLFFASPEEIPHLFSGQHPNSFSQIYDRVNEGLLLGKGTLRVMTEEGLDPMEWINIGAHVSFPLLLLANRVEGKENIHNYLETVLDVHIDRINIIGKLFVDGEDKETIKQALIKLHREAPATTQN